MFRSALRMTRVPLLSLALATIASMSAQSPQYVQGPRGGCYEVTKSGSKKSVDRSLCGASAPAKTNGPAPADANQTAQKTRSTPPPTTASVPQTAPARTTVKGNRTYVKGPKGGCYYVTASGRKEYVDRSMCQ